MLAEEYMIEVLDQVIHYIAYLEKMNRECAQEILTLQNQMLYK
jgi:hypothetical protein